MSVNCRKGASTFAILPSECSDRLGLEDRIVVALFVTDIFLALNNIAKSETEKPTF